MFILFIAIETGSLMDKTKNNNWIYIPNDDKQNDPFNGLNLLVKKVRH